MLYSNVIYRVVCMVMKLNTVLEGWFASLNETQHCIGGMVHLTYLNSTLYWRYGSPNLFKLNTVLEVWFASLNETQHCIVGMVHLTYWKIA